jgi:hypothetical protein
MLLARLGYDDNMVRKFLVVSMAVWLSACSWMFMHKPQPDYSPEVHGPALCTSGKGWAWADAGIATYIYLLTAMFTATIYSHENSSLSDAAVTALIVGTPAVLYTRSSVTGFDRSRRCLAQRASFGVHSVSEQPASPAIDEPLDPRISPPVEAHVADELPVGAEGGPCTGGGACDPGLVCDVEIGTCIDDQPSIGAEGGPCTAGGGCDPGLTCDPDEHICYRGDEDP